MPLPGLAWVIAILVIAQDAGTAVWSRFDLFGTSWWSLPTIIRLAGDAIAVLLILIPGTPSWLQATVLFVWFVDHGVRIWQSLGGNADGFFPTLVFLVPGAIRTALVLVMLGFTVFSGPPADAEEPRDRDPGSLLSSDVREEQPESGDADRETDEAADPDPSTAAVATEEVPGPDEDSVLSLQHGELRRGRGLRWSQLQPARSLSVTGSAVAVHGGRIWLLGGGSASIPFGQDSYRIDPGTGTVQQYRAPWPPRNHASAVSFRGELWLLGGQGTVPLNDIWSSRDGITWTFRGNAPFLGRWDHELSVIDDRLIVTGGTDGQRAFSDTWTTENGLTWQREQQGTWEGRSGHAVVGNGDVLYLAGGTDSDGTILSDLWRGTVDDSGLRWEKQGSLLPMSGHAMFWGDRELLIVIPQLAEAQAQALTIPLSRRGTPRLDRTEIADAGTGAWTGARMLPLGGELYFVGGQREASMDAALLRRID